MLFDLVIQIHHMQDVHQLTLVLMQTFDLYIKNGTRIHIDSVMLTDVLSQTKLVQILDLHELLLCLFIIRIDCQFFHMRKICHPLMTDLFVNPCRQLRICMQQEPTLCDTVRLVIEFFREHLVEITQLLLFQDLCMQCRNTIYRIAGCDRKMCHADLTVEYDRHSVLTLIIAREFLFNLKAESAVDLVNDLHNTRQQP